MLQGKNIIVTGSAGGIGREIVRLLVEQGAFVWACCRKLNGESSNFFAQFGEQVEPVCFDLADPEAIAGAMK